MKRTILLSTLILTQSIFATTLTIYNNNKTLVNEEISLNLKKESSLFEYDDIPSTLIANSVHLQFPKEVTLLSQIYKNKKFLPQKEAKKSQVKPKLLFHLHTSKAIHKKAALSYLTSGISFTTDYEINIEKNSAEIHGWIDIINNSGKNFKNATIRFLAGRVHQAYQRAPRLLYSDAAVATKSMHYPKEQSFSGYHIYSLEHKTDLNAYEQYRLPLLQMADIPFERHNIARMNNPLYLMGERSSNVMQELHFKGLKKAAPSGIVRIYAQEDKQRVLLGEDNLNNTPKNHPFVLKLGEDFDTKIQQRIISRNDTKELFDAKVEYILNNHSDEDRVMTLQIPFYKKEGSKVISKLNYSYTKGNLVTFTLKVAANSKRSFDVEFISKRR